MSTQFQSLLSAVLSLSVLVGSVRADSTKVDDQVLGERFQQISRMTQVERDHLQRNIAEFQKLPADRQDYYRELNRQVEEDKNLSNLMQTYSAWLQTLTPGQREELRKETDSAKKLMLVRKFKAEQYHPLDVVNDLGGGTQRLPGKPITPAELNAMIKILVAELPQDDQERFGRANRADQYVDVITRHVQQSTDPRTWPNAELQEKLLGVVKRDDVKHFAKSRPGHEREVLVRLLFNNVVRHAVEEGSKLPTAAEIQNVLGQLDAEDKVRIEQFRPERKWWELTRRFFEQRNDPTLRHADDIRTRLDRLLPQLNLPGPGPLLGEGFRGPGLRPGRRPEDRDRPGRGDGPPGPPPGEPPPPGPPRDGRPPRRPGER